MEEVRGSSPLLPTTIQENTAQCGVFLYYTENFKGLERADRRHIKNSKNIAVVIDAIVWHHTAPACRKAVALVRGSPLLPTNIKMHRVTFGAFLCPNKGREPEGYAILRFA